MKIRKAIKEDRKQFIILAKKADQRPKYWSERRFTKFIREKGNLFLFAEEKDKLIGYVGIKRKEEEEGFTKINFDNLACIAWIAVLPGFREKRIGSHLLKESEKYAKKWKKEGIWLDCRYKVLDFYIKNNYHVKGCIIKEINNKKFRKYFLEKRWK
jgi:ribosomal protein S18 acetylase RimI-like enzyme